MLGPTLFDIGPSLTKLGLNLANLGRIWPILATAWPTSSKSTSRVRHRTRPPNLIAHFRQKHRTTPHFGLRRGRAAPSWGTEPLPAFSMERSKGPDNADKTAETHDDDTHQFPRFRHNLRACNPTRLMTTCVQQRSNRSSRRPSGPSAGRTGRPRGAHRTPPPPEHLPTYRLPPRRREV